MKGLLCAMLLSSVACDLIFSAGFSNDAILQRSDTKGAAIYGFANSTGPITVKVDGKTKELATVSYTVQAETYAWKGAGVYPDTSDPPVHGTTVWKATLKPASAGGDYSITVTQSAAETATIARVSFGDVWFCSGQSNMALETFYTFSADALKAEIAGGKYKNLRHFMFGSMGDHYEALSPQWVTSQNSVTAGPEFVWHNVTSSAALPSMDKKSGAHSAWAQFSSTCMYFGVELIAAREAEGIDADVPVGLIQSAIGGSQIESWMDNHTLTTCTDESLAGGAIPANSGRLYYGMVAPFANYSVRGWLWYQGEVRVRCRLTHQ
jgi:hypothetical protein